MKKITAILLIGIFLVMFFAGCQQEKKKEDQQQQEQTERITPSPNKIASDEDRLERKDMKVVPSPSSIPDENRKQIELKGEATDLFATVKTDKGDIKIKLFPEVAPNTVLNFVTLAKKGFYDGLNFHRVESGFVIQGGCPKGDGTGDPGYSIPAEFNERQHLLGTVAMARAQDPNSAGCQFYICLGKAAFLDRKYTVFGQVVEGLSTVQNITRGDIIKTITIEGELPQELQGKEVVKSGVR